MPFLGAFVWADAKGSKGAREQLVWSVRLCLDLGPFGKKGPLKRGGVGIDLALLALATMTGLVTSDQ